MKEEEKMEKNGATEEEVRREKARKALEEAGPFAGSLATLEALEKRAEANIEVMEALEESEREPFIELMGDVNEATCALMPDL